MSPLDTCGKNLDITMTDFTIFGFENLGQKLHCDFFDHP